MRPVTSADARSGKRATQAEADGGVCMRGDGVEWTGDIAAPDQAAPLRPRALSANAPPPKRRPSTCTVNGKEGAHAEHCRHAPVSSVGHGVAQPPATPAAPPLSAKQVELPSPPFPSRPLYVCIKVKSRRLDAGGHSWKFGLWQSAVYLTNGSGNSPSRLKNTAEKQVHAGSRSL
jgi:hypothetical protein